MGTDAGQQHPKHTCSIPYQGSTIAYQEMLCAVTAAVTCSLGTMLGAGGTEPEGSGAARPELEGPADRSDGAGARRRLPPFPAPCVHNRNTMKNICCLSLCAAAEGRQVATVLAKDAHEGCNPLLQLLAIMTQ